MGKKILPLMLAGCIFLGGCVLLAYPKVSQWLNGLHQSEVIADYSSAVDGLNDEDAEKELQRAADYNRELTDTVSLADPFENKLEENDQYPTLLNFTAEGVMGYIEIPKINVLLPIYHGVSSGVLSKGIGHLPETSLPVGGTSTHCVLAGHSGMSNARLFTDLPKLENGDVFYLHIYNKTLTYTVDQVKKVLPTDTSDLTIVDSKDYSADQIHHGALPCHVHLILDEFAAMPLPGFTRELATMRSRNISASTIIQNMAQIKSLYKDDWETIPGNSDSILYLEGNEASTHKYISEMLGKSTIDLKTHGESKGRSGSYSTNYQMTSRELLTPDEVRKLDNRYAILFIRGAKPVRDQKYDLMKHPAIRQTSLGGGAPYIHHSTPAQMGTPLFAPMSHARKEQP